ncbi:transposase family protein [Streptosporangium sp. G12]
MIPHRATLDVTLLPMDRCAEQTTSVKGEQIDRWYSGKAHHHAGNVQALSAPDGLPLWVSDVEPGSIHDLAAAPAKPATSPAPPSSSSIPSTIIQPKFAEISSLPATVGLLLNRRRPDRHAIPLRRTGVTPDGCADGCGCPTMGRYRVIP